MALDGVALSSSEVSVIQSFVNGDLIEAQARQLLQNAQVQPDAGKLIADAQEAKIITPDQAGKMIDAIAGKKGEAPVTEAAATTPPPVAEEPPAIAGRIDPSQFVRGTTTPEGAAQSVPRGPLNRAG